MHIVIYLSFYHYDLVESKKNLQPKNINKTNS